MRKLERLPLSAAAMDYLQTDRSAKVAAAADPKAEAARLWHSKSRAIFCEVRNTLQEMAPGIQHCMYCENNEATDIEHFWPKSTYPERAFEWANYLLACSNCNSNHKRNRFPLDDGEPLLIDPTVDEPQHHLELTPTEGIYKARTTKGSHSIAVFGLERGTLRKGRKHAWKALQALIVSYDDELKAGETTEAEYTRQVICEHPFASLLIRLLELSQCEDAAYWIKSTQCLDALKRHPDIGTWL